MCVCARVCLNVYVCVCVFVFACLSVCVGARVCIETKVSWGCAGAVTDVTNLVVTEAASTPGKQTGEAATVC